MTPHGVTVSNFGYVYDTEASLYYQMNFERLITVNDSRVPLNEEELFLLQEELKILDSDVSVMGPALLQEAVRDGLLSECVRIPERYIAQT